MITIKELTDLSNVDVDSCSVNDLVDIENITVNKKRSTNERTLNYIDTVKNPYLFKVGDIVVKTNFNPKGKKFSKAIADIIETK